MNEEAKKKLSEFLTKALDAAEKGGDFILEQAPLVAQEAVAYGRAFHTSAVVVGVLVLVVGGIVGYRLVRRGLAALSEDNMSDGGFFSVLSGIVTLFFSLGMGVVQVNGHMSECLMAWFAPRLYLIEYAKELVK